jgi:hypothetical protein
MIGSKIVSVLFVNVFVVAVLDYALPTESAMASSEPASIPGEQSNDDVVNCAALGCPGNPPNPHGPPTEEPEGDE